ncbi:hypothetical protein PFICI_05344 [Pestalotiopsis fici W106-1]|uniref:SRP9 domain-containing protein n=1 Tax=Pestalotiopsis fici (strain W106-1 / CGMCC3.15140) TaxID=1229662 RepID=W3XBK6_PESFW|nr:uncharacterized protein PFICI_05344 [Pestalotiopsis fici W106-1]ETS83468.1 hypothetical protein PFICI_05344 [Pestalotiopsis fici W106-1]
MPYYASADEWLRQSQLLLEARPTTTRVTTRYSIRSADAPRKSKGGEDGKKTEAAAAAASGEAKPPRGRLVLKTFDPKTGTTLKYKTSKAAEVSRLILSLGKLGRPMAGLPALKDDGVPALDAPESGMGTPAPEKADPVPAQQGQQPGGGSGGGKGKKKKGKR